MPKRTNAFQNLVYLIHSAVAPEAKVEPSAMVTDKTDGEPREVDVFITSQAGLGVEVIDRTRKADVQWVEQQCKKHEHLRIDKLILVSRSGFTRRALEKAEFFGAEPLTFSDALTTDWDLARRLTAAELFVLYSFQF
jgi:hypothetical protein